MKQKEMSIGQQLFFVKILSGAAWIAAGIFGLFENSVCSIIQMIFLVISLACVLKVMYAEKEATDEMADEHLLKAKAKTLDFMHRFFLLCVGVAFLLVNLPLTLTVNLEDLLFAIYFIVIGVEDLLTGIYFKKLEE